MIILRLLGSSDDKEKEKIGVARPKGPPLWGFRIGSGAPEDPTPWASEHPVVVGRTDASMFGVGGNRSQVSLQAPVEPTGQNGASVHWPSFVPEAMSVPRRSVFSTGSTDGASVHTTGVMTSASRRRFLQHRLNR